MSQFERMLAGKLYHCGVHDEKREAEREKWAEFLDAFNATAYGDFAAREQLARERFAYMGQNCCINKPFHCDYGCNISV